MAAPNGWTLDQPPRVGAKQWVRVSANFISELGQDLVLYWLPADSAINGFDDNNMAELTELRFVYGVLTGHDSERRTLELQPRKIQTLLDLTQDSTPVTETDTLMDGTRYEAKLNRYTCVAYSFEGDVSSTYIFMDRQLVFLEQSVWDDAVFWIGNSRLPQPLLEKSSRRMVDNKAMQRIRMSRV